MQKTFVSVAILLAFTALFMPIAASAGGLNQFLAFGDSTLDTGYFRYHTTGDAVMDKAIAIAVSNGATGGWAGNGVMNTTILAGKFGLRADTVANGGGNYANGGATTVVNDQPVIPNNVTTLQQIQNYLTAVNGVANPNALYLIKSGDNDATYYTNQGPAWMAAHPNYLSDGAAQLAASVARLQAAGARTIVVRNSYDYALMAGLGGVIPPDQADAYARSVGLWKAEWANLTALGVRFIPADNDSLFKYVAKNPTLFGFTPSSALSANAPSPLPAIMAIATPEQQQTYLWINGPHLSTAGQTIEADYTYSLLTAPSQMSLITEGAVQGGLARAATIQGQIDLSGQHRGPNGINMWTSAGASSQKIKNASGFPTDSGTPFSGSVGVDYRTTSGVVVGAAFTAGGQRQDFSTGGHFDQTDEAISLYAAHKIGPFWGNAVATYGQFQDRISRQVPLGIFIDQNNADTNGLSQALALRAGGDLKLGPVTTGPVAGVVMQKIWLDGFTETGACGVSALSFEGITRDSLVSQLGWRASLDLGPWQPFAEAKWNHEWADRDRTVTASLTSVAAPAYSMAAVPVSADWATTSLGASYKLNSRVMLRGEASAAVFSSEVTSYGGELGVNVSF
ncbi:MAG: autotransporter domain-containing protein [Pseudomonadota bacterium]